ncbi:MAG: SAM-dependent methyltransferase [Clostridiales bacterium]|nr:SAM-dependent methyltransferase [Clostridiales bacterium]
MHIKRLPKLDARTQRIYEFVDNVDSVADIGCDHGRLSLLLAYKGLKVIATDISKPSLEKAQNLAKRHEVIVDTRLGDGLSMIGPEEVQAIIIAGMGQNTIINILNNAEETVDKAQYVIMQSMNGDYDLRYFLSNNGFEIIDESLVLDGKRLYCIIKAQSGSTCILGEVERYLGPVLIMSDDENFSLYLKSNIEVIKEIINGMKEARNQDRKRLKNLSEVLADMEDIYNV